jgi:hypothetical protein
VTHSTAEINGQPLVKEYDDPYNKASNSVNIDINPTNEQTIKGEVDDSSKVIGDSPLFNREDYRQSLWTNHQPPVLSCLDLNQIY